MKTYMKEFLSFWQSLSGTTDIPALSSLTSEKLHKYRDAFFLFERGEAGNVTVRSCGQYFSQSYGVELRGRDFLSIFPDDQRLKGEEVYSYLFDHPCGVINQRTGFLSSGETVRLRSIVLPLKDQDGEIRYGVGLLEFHRADGKAHLSPGGDLSRSISVHPQYLDIGYGAPC